MTKSFSWSYSKLKNFETCPRRYSETELKKSVTEARTQELDRGDALHAAMYDRVIGATPLPAAFLYMEPWAQRLTRVLHPMQITQGELKLAANNDNRPTGYFDKTTWVRTKIDYLRIIPSKGGKADIGHVVDYKTGNPARSDPTQLLVNAFIIFGHYNSIASLRVDYLWTEYNDTTHENYTRDETPAMFAEQVTPRVIKLEQALARDEFPPKPGGLCAEYCPVSSCEHHGKRHRR